SMLRRHAPASWPARFRRRVCCLLDGAAPPEISSLSLHDALPICGRANQIRVLRRHRRREAMGKGYSKDLRERAVAMVEEGESRRSEEHTSELQSLTNLVCRLVLAKQEPHPAAPRRNHRTPVNHPT